MKKFLTLLLFGLSLLAMPLQAQDIDNSFVFVDEDGEIIADGATVVRNTVEQYDEGTEVIYSGISVLNVSAPASQSLKMHYSIKQIDNGSYQICFPITCNTRTEVGDYVTSDGTLMSDLQDIQSEWFPTADGTCIVELRIELVTKSGFPPTVSHQAWGRSMTLKFVKGGAPEPIKGDVNGDGEVGISDVNALVDMILSGADFVASADVDKDGEIGISDVNAVIDIILSGN